MPISVGNGQQVAPNLPKTKKRKPAPAKKADPRGFVEKLDIGPAAIKNPIQRAADNSRKRLERTADRLNNRGGLKRQLETSGVTAGEWKELRATSNAHDRRLLDDYARRAAELVKRISRRVEKSGVVRSRAVPGDAPGHHVPGRVGVLGLGTIDAASLGTDLVHRLGPVAPFFASIPRALDSTKTGALIIAKETAEHPAKTAEGLLETGLSGLAAVPEVAAETVKETAKGHPLKPVKRLSRAWLRDLQDRYGPLYDGDTKAFEDRLEKHGTASELLDVAGILGTAGVTAGRTAGAAARAGALGRDFKRLATRDRPGLQLTGARARPQRLSKNLGVVAIQRLEDRARARKTERKAADAGTANGGDALAAAAREAGNVIALNPRQAKKQLARQKGIARLEQQARLDDEARSLRRSRRILTRDERDAYKYAVQYGIRSDSDIDEALGRLADQIHAKRGESSFTPGRRDVDELQLLDAMAENPRDYFTPVLDEIANEARNRALVAGRRDPTMMEDAHTRRARAPQAELLGVRRWEPPEDGSLPDLSFLPDRDMIELARRRRELGLAVGGYFPSRRGGPRSFTEWTMGSSLRGPGRHRKYEGRLRELGIEDNTPELLDAAIARNVNNDLRLREVTRTLEQEALPWSKGEGKLPHHTAQRLYDLGAERGIDPRTWVAVNVGSVDEALQGTRATGALGEYDLGGDRGIFEALEDSKIDGEMIAANPARYRAIRGYVAIPRVKYDELRALEQPTGRGTRMWNNAKGGFSRAMLGLNPTWLPFQVAGNVVQSALSGALPGKTRALRQAMDQLTPDERRRADALLGIGQVSESFNRQHLGSLAGRLARSWQELRETRVGRGAAKVNPVRAMFTLDRKQNNAFRRSVANAELKRLERSAQDGAGVLDRLLGGTRATADDYARILRNPEQLAQLADHTNRFLGDFTSLTALERRALVPSVMFYGWLRHSLKLLFWTMPTTRPIVGSVIGQLGKLHANEIRELFGDDAPEWLFTYAVLGRTRDGQPIGINAARFIPFANAVADPGNIENPFASILLVRPPPVQAVLNSAFGQDLFSGRRVGEYGREPALRDRVGLFLRTAIGAPIAPIRIADRVANPKEYETEPGWLRLLQQTTPIPRAVPYSANGRREKGGSWGGGSSSGGGSWGGSSSGGSWGGGSSSDGGSWGGGSSSGGGWQ